MAIDHTISQSEDQDSCNDPADQDRSPAVDDPEGDQERIERLAQLEDTHTQRHSQSKADI